MDCNDHLYRIQAYTRPISRFFPMGRKRVSVSFASSDLCRLFSTSKRAEKLPVFRRFFPIKAAHSWIAHGSVATAPLSRIIHPGSNKEASDCV